MTINLRGHHLICLHFFEGEGYDPAFIANLAHIVKGAEHEDIIVCDEADDVCNHCTYLRDNMCRYNEQADKEIRDMDMLALSLLDTRPGAVVRWHDIKERIAEIFYEWYKNYCAGCDWKNACAENSFYRELKGKIMSEG